MNANFFSELTPACRPLLAPSTRRTSSYSCPQRSRLSTRWDISQSGVDNSTSLSESSQWKACNTVKLHRHKYRHRRCRQYWKCFCTKMRWNSPQKYDAQVNLLILTKSLLGFLANNPCKIWREMSCNFACLIPWRISPQRLSPK